MSDKQEKVVLEWQKSIPVKPELLTEEFCANAHKILDMGIEEMPGYSFDCVLNKIICKFFPITAYIIAAENNEVGLGFFDVANKTFCCLGVYFVVNIIMKICA